MTNPSIRTLIDIANRLGTTVGDLLGEPWPVSPDERRKLIAVTQVIDRLVAQGQATGRSIIAA